MQDLFSAIATLNQYGWLAVTVFVVCGFIFGIVVTRGHHIEVVTVVKEQNTDLREQNRSLRSENDQLRQALSIVHSQATRATASAAAVMDRVQGGL